MSFSVLSKIYDISGKKIFRWYRNVLSWYTEAWVSRQLHEHDIIDKKLIDRITKSPKKIYVPILKAENFGPNMAIDDKNIWWEVYTIISNKDTWKIAAMIMSIKFRVIYEVLDKIPQEIRWWVKTISKDFAQSYDWVARICFPCATRIWDKFHVISMVFDALQAVRIRYRQKALEKERVRRELHKKKEAENKELAKKNWEYYIKKGLPKSKRYDNEDTEMELLARSRWLLFKLEKDWSDTQRERAKILFKEYPEIKKAYSVICSFRWWYNYKPKESNKKLAAKGLNRWYKKALGVNIIEIDNIVSSIEYHAGEILNYFHDGWTNAFAESINAKIQRFVQSNYWIRDRDFFHFRLMKFLS